MTMLPSCRCQRRMICAAVTPVLGRERQDHGILQDLPAAQRAPCLREDAELAVLFAEFVLLEPGMQLDLVDGGHHFGGLQQPVQVGRLEVGDADGPDPALAVERFQRPLGFGEQARSGRASGSGTGRRIPGPG